MSKLDSPLGERDLSSKPSFSTLSDIHIPKSSFQSLSQIPDLNSAAYSYDTEPKDEYLSFLNRLSNIVVSASPKEVNKADALKPDKTLMPNRSLKKKKVRISDHEYVKYFPNESINNSTLMERSSPSKSDSIIFLRSAKNTPVPINTKYDAVGLCGENAKKTKAITERPQQQKREFHKRKDPRFDLGLNDIGARLRIFSPGVFNMSPYVVEPQIIKSERPKRLNKFYQKSKGRTDKNETYDVEYKRKPPRKGKFDGNLKARESKPMALKRDAFTKKDEQKYRSKEYYQRRRVYDRIQISQPDMHNRPYNQHKHQIEHKQQQKEVIKNYTVKSGNHGENFASESVKCHLTEVEDNGSTSKTEILDFKETDKKSNTTTKSNQKSKRCSNIRSSLILTNALPVLANYARRNISLDGFSSGKLKELSVDLSLRRATEATSPSIDQLSELGILPEKSQDTLINLQRCDETESEDVSALLDEFDESQTSYNSKLKQRLRSRFVSGSSSAYSDDSASTLDNSTNIQTYDHSEQIQYVPSFYQYNKPIPSQGETCASQPSTDRAHNSSLSSKDISELLSTSQKTCLGVVFPEGDQEFGYGSCQCSQTRISRVESSPRRRSSVEPSNLSFGQSLLLPSPKRSASVEPPSLRCTCADEPLPYDPFLLDNPALDGRIHTMLDFGAYTSSLIEYSRPIDLKLRMNQIFRAKFPYIDLTLSKFRSIKRDMLSTALEAGAACNLWMVAQAYVFFEKVILKGLISKSNRKCVAGAALLLSAKLNDVKPSDILALIQSIESNLRISHRDLIDHELAMTLALDFRLLLTDYEILPHYDKLYDSYYHTFT